MARSKLPAAPIELSYRLPVTAVTFSGRVTETRDDLAPPESRRSTTREGTALVSVIADPRTGETVSMPVDVVDKLSASVKLTADGRLTDASASYDDQSSDRLLAMAKMTIAGGTLGLSLGGPLGLGVGALAGAVTGAVGASAVDMFKLRGLVLPPLGGEPAAPDEEREKSLTELAKDLGIEPTYKEQVGDFELLVLYRQALVRLSLRHARAAGEGAADPAARTELRELDKALRSTRAEAARAEQAYEDWKRTKSKSTSELFEFRLFVDQLPTEGALLTEVAQHVGQHSDAQPWWRIATTLGVMVTCDLEGELPSVGTAGASAGTPGATLAYRPLVPARVVTWKFVHGTAGDWSAHVQSVERLLVATPRLQRRVPVPFTANSDQSITLSFGPDGGILGVTSDVASRSGERSQALSKLVDDSPAAAKAGADLGAAFSPGAARVAALKQQLDEAESRKKLNGILNPSKDELADLRDEVTKAELDARAAIAHAIAADPTRAFVVVRQLEQSAD